MTRWIERILPARALRKRPTTIRNSPRLTLETLEDRTTPATGLAAPTLLDPTAAVRVDLGSYSIRGALAEAAKSGTSVLAYRDTNSNGAYDAGIDALAASVAVAKGTKAFSVPVPLSQNAANQFFLVAIDGKLRTAPTKTGAITEDSTAPKVVSITRLSAPLTNAGSVQFQVRFSEAVTGVDPTDFAVAKTGSVTAPSGGVSVSGSGATYTVTVSGIGGAGMLGLSLTDNDTIRDVLTNPAQAHALGGVGAGNGSFVAGETYTIDRLSPTVSGIARVGSVVLDGPTATFTVSFDEAVTGVDATDFSLVTSGLTGATLTAVTGSGATYTATADIGTGTGSIRLGFADVISVTDLAGNALDRASFVGGESFLTLAEGTDSLATVVLPALNLDLLGLRVQTSEIVVSVAADAANGKLLGNLLTTASNLIDLQEAADALNQVLSTTVGLLNSSDLGINLGGGSFDTRPIATTDVLTLHVAPVDLDLLGALVNTARST